MSRRRVFAALATALGFALPDPTFAEDRAGETATRKLPRLGGPDAVENQIDSDEDDSIPLIPLDLLDDYQAWKGRIREQTGIRFGGDYSTQGFYATESLDEDGAAGGMYRFFGVWELVGRGSENTGAFVWKIEYRDRYFDIAPSEMASEIGYVGLMGAPFSKERWRTTNLYWRQRFAGGRATFLAGFLDATDYVDVYRLASPWTGFTNLVFSTGSGSIPLPADSQLGFAIGGMLTEQLYAIASFGDANGDPPNPFEGFETFFDEREYFSSLEAGWTSSQDQIAEDNVHVTFWHVDERDDAGTPDGFGFNLSAAWGIGEHWMPFVRAGWADDGGSLLEWSVSAGVGYELLAGRDQLGAALNYGDPNADTFGSGLDDQWTLEVFYRWQVFRQIALTPSVQWIHDPALHPGEDEILVLGMRIRFAL